MLLVAEGFESLSNICANVPPSCQRVDAAVAYVTKTAAFLRDFCNEGPKGADRTLRLFARRDANRSVDDIGLLRQLLNAGVELRLLERLHAKVIWWRGHGAYIGSANLSESAWERNLECGVFLREDELFGGEAGIGSDLDRFFEDLVHRPLMTVDGLERLPTAPELVHSGAAPVPAPLSDSSSDVWQILVLRRIAEALKPRDHEFWWALSQRDRTRFKVTQQALEKEYGIKQPIVSKVLDVFGTLPADITDHWRADSTPLPLKEMHGLTKLPQHQWKAEYDRLRQVKKR